MDNFKNNAKSIVISVVTVVTTLFHHFSKAVIDHTSIKVAIEADLSCAQMEVQTADLKGLLK